MLWYNVIQRGVNMIVYFDTNIIHGKTLLGKVLEKFIISMQNNYQAEIMISDIVLKEHKQHAFTQIDEHFKKAVKEERQILQIIGDYDNIDKVTQEYDDKSKKRKSEYETNVREFCKKNRITVLNSKRSIDIDHLEQMINMAIGKIPPFEQEDKGFRDACIMFSLLGYLSSNEDKKVFFVSNDKIYQKQNVIEIFNEYNVQCVESISQVLSQLSDKVSDLAKAYIGKVEYYMTKQYDDEESVLKSFNSRNYANEYGGYDEADEVIPLSAEVTIVSEVESEGSIVYSCIKKYQVSGVSYAYFIGREKSDPETVPYRPFLTFVTIEYLIYIDKKDIVELGLEDYTISTDKVFCLDVSIEKVEFDDDCSPLTSLF